MPDQAHGQEHAEERIECQAKTRPPVWHTGVVDEEAMEEVKNTVPMMRRKYQLTRNRVQLHNRLEALLEEAQVKLFSLVSDLMGVRARRMLKALGDGETYPAVLAAMADKKLRATPTQLCDALGACTELNAVCRRLLKMTPQELQIARAAGRPTGPADGESAQPAPGLGEATGEDAGVGVDSAQQIMAEVGCGGSDVSFSQAALLVVWWMPWR